MKSALDFKNNRCSKQKIKQQKTKGKSMEYKLCYSCIHLRSQLKELKWLQRELSNGIKQTLQTLKKQAQFIVYSVLAKVKGERRLDEVFNITKYSSTQFHPTYNKEQRENKQNEGYNLCSTLKKDIFQEFKMLKVLQNRSNHLRQTNLKLSTMRKSLSKQSLVSCKVQTNHFVRKTKQNLNTNAFNQKVYTQQTRQISPEFGEDKKVNKFPFKNNISRQFFSLTDKYTKEKPDFKLLKCVNGHVYYRGTTQKNLPHGSGTLINCCSKMPIKVKSKVVQYQGEFVNGQFEGNGVLKCKGEVRFEGCFKKGLRNGKGVIYLSGMSETGIWQNDQLKSKF